MPDGILRQPVASDFRQRCDSVGGDVRLVRLESSGPDDLLDRSKKDSLRDRLLVTRDVRDSGGDRVIIRHEAVKVLLVSERDDLWFSAPSLNVFREIGLCDLSTGRDSVLDLS